MVHDLRKFLCFINSEIHVDNFRVPHALRENDKALMESLLETQHFTCTDLYCLNLCRIYLRVEFLSEFCNAEGDNILPEVWQGQQPHKLTSNLLLWPKQACPFEKSWTLWRGALKLAGLSPKVHYLRAVQHTPYFR